MNKERAYVRDLAAERLRDFLWGATVLCALTVAGKEQTALGANQAVVVTGARVNLRSRPALDGEVLTQVNTGTVLSLRGQPGNSRPTPGQSIAWARVQLPASVPVWVHATYLQGETVWADHLNLRSGPGENYGILGQLKSGDKIAVRARRGNWIQIDPPAQVEAYVAANYVAPLPPPAVAATPAKRQPVVPTAAPPVLRAKPPVPVPGSMVTKAPPGPASGSEVRLPDRTAARPVPATIASQSLPNRPATVATRPVPAEPKSVEKPPQEPPPVAAAILPDPKAPGASLPQVSISEARPDQLKSEAPQEPVVRAASSQPPVLLAQAPSPAEIASPKPVKENLEARPQTAVPVAAASPSPILPEPPAAGAPDSPPIPDAQLKLEPASARPKNEFSMGYFLTWNISAQFKNSGGALFAAPVPGEYDDGYVRPSSRGNVDGYTWNWGYQHASQVDAANDRLVFSRASVVAGGDYGTTHSTPGSDMNQGVEWTYHRLLWEPPDQNARLGLEASFGYGWLEFKDNRLQTADVQVDRFAYALNGIQPPPAPYNGTFQGPGPLLFNQPTALASERIANGALVASTRALELDLYNFRFGPRLTVDVTQRLFGMVSAGVAVMLADGTFEYRDAVQSGANLPASGHNSRLSVLPGGYLGLGLGYQLSQSWGVSYQIHFQYNDSYQQNLGGRSVELGLNPSLFQTFGLSYSF